MPQPGDMRQAADELARRHNTLTPAEFTAACHDFRRDWGTLPRPLPDLRRTALRAIRAEAARNGQKIGFVARLHGFSPNRFSKLTSTTGEAAA